ncbi:FlgN protein [Phycisphaerae bacterium RAS1]|nr:FlgN protein [Phycisphaerae bacterium RAS1]
MSAPCPAAPDVRLKTLLTQQRDHYLRLQQLSRQQREMISSDRPELLLGILSERQTLVSALARLNQELSPFRRNWDANYAALPATDKADVSALLQEINALLRGILATDQQDSALLAARKHTVRQELDGLGGAQTAASAYVRQSGAAPPQRAADITG